MSKLLIVFLILAFELLPTDSWLNKHNLIYVIPICYSLLLILILLLSVFGFANAFHWYDCVIQSLPLFMNGWYFLNVFEKIRYLNKKTSGNNYEGCRFYLLL